MEILTLAGVSNVLVNAQLAQIVSILVHHVLKDLNLLLETAMLIKVSCLKL